MCSLLPGSKRCFSTTGNAPCGQASSMVLDQCFSLEGVEKDEKRSIEKRRERKQPSKTFERIGSMGKYALERMPYPSDVTDEEWARLEPLIPAAKPGGRPQTTNMREAILASIQIAIRRLAR